MLFPSPKPLHDFKWRKFKFQSWVSRALVLTDKLGNVPINHLKCTLRLVIKTRLKLPLYSESLVTMNLLEWRGGGREWKHLFILMWRHYQLIILGNRFRKSFQSTRLAELLKKLNSEKCWTWSDWRVFSSNKEISIGWAGRVCKMPFTEGEKQTWKYTILINQIQRPSSFTCHQKHSAEKREKSIFISIRK